MSLSHAAEIIQKTAKSFVVMSDGLYPDTVAVYLFQSKISYIRQQIGKIRLDIKSLLRRWGT